MAGLRLDRSVCPCLHYLSSIIYLSFFTDLPEALVRAHCAEKAPRLSGACPGPPCTHCDTGIKAFCLSGIFPVFHMAVLLCVVLCELCGSVRAMRARLNAAVPCGTKVSRKAVERGHPLSRAVRSSGVASVASCNGLYTRSPPPPPVTNLLGEGLPVRDSWKRRGIRPPHLP